MKEKLQKVRSSLDYIISTLACANIAGVNASLQQAKVDAIDMCETIDSILSTLDSEELVDGIKSILYDNMVCNIEYSQEEGGAYIPDYSITIAAKAAIEAIKEL